MAAHRGRPRKIRSAAQMARLWEEFKEHCDHYEVPVTEFSAKNSEFVSSKVKKRISYTIEGFCVFIGLARSKFYQIYDNDPDFGDIITRIREECEADTRAKFEVGTIPPQLAPLWMSKFGYSVKTEAKADGKNELLESLMDMEREARK